MAKKKVTQPSQKQKEFVKSNKEITPPSSMETEKIDSLKSSNQILLMEAIERRQLVDSLLQCKGSLEMDLTRSESEREALESELKRLVEWASLLEVERVVVAVFVAAQVGVKREGLSGEIKGLEMDMREWKRETEGIESEIARLNLTLIEIEGALGDERAVSRQVCSERNDLEDTLNQLIKEDERLRVNLDAKMTQIERQIKELHTAYTAVVRKKKDMEMKIKLLMGERDLSERGLMESNKVIDKMKKEISGIVREKESEIARLNLTLVEIEGALGDERAVSRQVYFERVDLEDKLNQQIKGGERLRVNLCEMDAESRQTGRELEEVHTAWFALVRETKDMEMKLELLIVEKDSSERGLIESKKVIEKMKVEIRAIVREKEWVEREKNDELIKSRELENVVTELHKMVANQKEEVKQLRVISELEKNCFAGQEKLNEMGRELFRLVENKEAKLSDKRITTLVDEKSVVEKDLGEAMKQLAMQKHHIADLANEKIVMVEAKNRVDGEVGELQTHVDELKATVLGLEELNRSDVERIRRLESEVREHMLNLEWVSVQRDGVEQFLHEEKQNASKLKEKIEELEKKFEECQKVAGELKAEYAAILAEKVELESHCETQRKEITCLQSKVELADAKSELVLDMLKGTSAFCSMDGGGQNGVVVDGEELKSHVMEMETIKNAFKSKAARVEDMEKQLEWLQSSVVDAEKWKSFWAMLSSATTVLAAISLAHVARRHRFRVSKEF